MRRIAGTLFTLCAFAALTGCVTAPTLTDTAPQNLAADVDMQRYMGKWYIIANVPYFAEAGKVASYFDIEKKGDTLLDIYYGRGAFDKPEGTFTMKDYIVPGSGNAYWRESPLWPFYFSYLVVYVDPDYKTALVGYPGHGYAWVMSREPKMDEATYQTLLARFATAGYDPSKLKKVPQFPEQVGQAGFQ